MLLFSSFSFLSVIRRDISVFVALQLLVCEAVGCFLAAAYAPLVWALLPASGHEWRAADLATDYALAPGEIPDLSVATSTGVLLEAGAMLASLTITFLIHATILDRRYSSQLTRLLPQYATALHHIISVLQTI